MLTAASHLWPAYVAAVLILAAAYLVARCCAWVKALLPEPRDPYQMPDAVEAWRDEKWRTDV